MGHQRRVTVPIPNGPLVDPKTGYATAAYQRTLQEMHNLGGFVEAFTQEVETLAKIPTNLTNEDQGTQITLHGGFEHVLEWNGSVWVFAPGDPGSGYYVTFGTGIVPQSSGWVLCDGRTTTYLVVGSVIVVASAFTVPVVAGQYFRR